MSATNHLDTICHALTEGRPLVLLLGQDAWRSPKNHDTLLELALRRAGRLPSDVQGASFRDLLADEPLPDDFYDWFAETYHQQPESEWMEILARLPLNAVFTSAIDPSIARALRASGRDIEPVLSKLDSPATPRNRRTLHLTYLFGRAGEQDPREAPPGNLRDLRQRMSLQAGPLLSRLLDTATPLGVLLIDGLVPDRDWLNSDLLAGILSAFSPDQVFWFGWSPSPASALFHDLAAPSGPVVFTPGRLAPALQSMELAGKINISQPRTFTEPGAITLKSGTLQVDASTRLKVSTVASIVEDSWLGSIAKLGWESEYAEFRKFHGHIEDASRLIDGLRRGFAIERTFESDLLQRVRRALATAGKRQEPILIHGQSGSGKSLALARLAYRVRESDRRHAVLLASRAIRLPAVEELDDFCLKAEEAGAEATLLVCDANVTVSRYNDLLRGFGSRGRRVVLVGSAYRVIDEGDGTTQSAPLDQLLEVPAELDSMESTSLAKLMARWIGSSPPFQSSSYLLPAIYRLLPEVRPRLASGLAREARVAEDNLRARGKHPSATTQSSTAIGQALVDAGVVDAKRLLREKLEEFLGTMTDAASRAIDFVMVPGKLDCPVPVNLLMRAVGGNESLTDVAALFSGIDLFRWSADDEGDIFVHPRLRVEAELITARRLGTAQAEAEVAVRLLSSASPGAYGTCERRFVLDFVHRLGPDGPFGRRYARHYLEIARALTAIRLNRGIMDPSFMLQEATLRRRVFRDAPETGDLDPAAVLEEARQIVDSALDEFGSGTTPGVRRACANLKVERAAIYGFRATQRLQSGGSLDEIWQFYKAARDSARTALFAADSYFAIDVSVWVPHDLLRGASWSPERRAELVADIWDGLERVDPTQLDPEQHERFEERRAKVAQSLGASEVAQDALAQLDRLGSAAGIFLRARDIGGPLWGTGPATHEESQRAHRAISFLEDQQDRVRNDARCLRYFLKCSWIVATGSYLFGGERSPLPEDEPSLLKILSLLDSLSDLEGALGDPRIQFLRAVVMWRLRREHAAREIWSSLSRETAFTDPRRVVRHHLWTEGGGKPKLFHGRIKSDDVHRGRARVQVEELRQEVELLQRDFPHVDLRRGAIIPGGFHIAFNFIGPVADPPGRSGGGR